MRSDALCPSRQVLRDRELARVHREMSQQRGSSEGAASSPVVAARVDELENELDQNSTAALERELEQMEGAMDELSLEQRIAAVLRGGTSSATTQEQAPGIRDDQSSQEREQRGELFGLFGMDREGRSLGHAVDHSCVLDQDGRPVDMSR